MAEEKVRILKVLEALSKCTDPGRPADIGTTIGETPLNVGHDLFELGKSGLAQKPDKKKSLYLITDKGREVLENPPEHWVSKSLGETPPGKTPEEITVPSQADLFKTEGQRLGIGSKKGDIRLEAIVTYVERIANLDDLNSVWNALTEMGVANDVKKRWIKLYSQNLPGKEIPAELKEKLEAGTEAEKVTTEKEPRRAKRFTVIDGQIMPDDEGEYSFSMAVQKAAVEKGASSSQAAEMATAMAKMNTDTINLLLPKVTKDPGEDSITKLLLTQMGELQKELRTPQGSPELQGKIETFTQQLNEMKETLHNEQLARIQEQTQTQIKELTGYIGRLQEQIKAVGEGKQAESKIGLLSHALDTTAKELSGIRSDLKPIAQTLMEGKILPGEKTAAEKAGFGTGLDKGIERAKEAAQLENELFFTGGPSSE